MPMLQAGGSGATNGGYERYQWWPRALQWLAFGAAKQPSRPLLQATIGVATIADRCCYNHPTPLLRGRRR
jgi:hypothetical protein